MTGIGNTGAVHPLRDLRAVHGGVRTWFKKCRCRVTPKTDGAALAKGFGVSSGTLI